MKVSGLLKMDIDIDVCDDYDESCYIAFCGPMELTPDGKERFKTALSRTCDLGDDIVILHADSDLEVNELHDLFYAMAGYCADSDYKRWFVEPN